MREGERLRLRAVEPSSERDLEAVTGLHMELLHFGPMSQLGRIFVKEICYRIHFEDRLLQGAVLHVDERPAGFVAYTDRSISFHRDSLRSHPLKTALVLLKSLIREPWRVAGLARAIRVVLARRHEQERLSDPLGEVVCVAARPEYLAGSFVTETGVRISERLIEHALEDLKRRGVEKVRMLVDADNKAPLFLYHRMGARFEKYDQAGQPVVEVWFDLGQAETECALQ